MCAVGNSIGECYTPGHKKAGSQPLNPHVN